MDSKENSAISNGEATMRDLTITGHIDDTLQIPADPEYRHSVGQQEHDCRSHSLSPTMTSDDLLVL